mmetsp:Transcript_31071/g.46888  ORF Transcript_31071/g.46888 Transcript_31071/m.46888 type:complete len:333 (+) Transcript_31071:146-1144(+)|eukprot:CAMPEP_0194754856 /NCGR_PEP_ID=MMETSP0323_2-20130528/8777_1 /TAXON_ID=2866 ORGANISM="Crypthecodinium cohnii, Strain Seligo" /NCGR_SAMPLE_ID=MMETSP0323_2 /ASSEMBLY_ACC=CAM_ASM_000346 /LENGTH=332 /DNA_ID=CAMNT_0039673603 /DNA_START=36 /DNA_END=1034 /DNA_ORIENTATION=+
MAASKSKKAAKAVVAEEEEGDDTGTGFAALEAELAKELDEDGKPILMQKPKKGALPPAVAAKLPKKKEAPSSPAVLGPLQAAVARRQPRKRAPPQAAVASDDPPDEEDGGGAGEDGATASRGSKRAKLLPQGTQAPTGLSLAPMVRQGLRSKDTEMLHQVLSNGDAQTIDSTVLDLSGPECYDLLLECTRKLMATPARGVQLCMWVKSVLQHRCAYILSQPSLQRSLQPLHDAFQARCGNHQTLLKLRGRLQALRASGQLALAAGTRQTSAVEAGALAPLMEYQEGDELAAEDDEDEDDDEDEGDSVGREGGSEEEGSFLDDSDDDDIFIDG